MNQLIFTKISLCRLQEQKVKCNRLKWLKILLVVLIYDTPKFRKLKQVYGAYESAMDICRAMSMAKCFCWRTEQKAASWVKLQDLIR